jgi:hypothetical protein
VLVQTDNKVVLAILLLSAADMVGYVVFQKQVVQADPAAPVLVIQY